jgi:hypothetical protein
MIVCLMDDHLAKVSLMAALSCQDFGQKGQDVTYLCEEGLVKRRTSPTD